MCNSLFICECIAEKMSNPEIVQEIIDTAIVKREFTSDLWPSWSFAEGFPGIAYFYSAMHQAFPGNNWEKIADTYIKLSLQSFKKYKIKNCSLFNGITGLSLAIYYASINNRYYQNLLLKMDDWLIEEVQRSFLNTADKYNDENTFIPPSFYNFAEGLSGIICYLLIRKDNPYLQILAKNCIDALTQLLLCNKLLENDLIPAWYSPYEHLFIEENNEHYINGGFISNMPFGISGCLTALSLAAIENINSINLYESVQLLAGWLKEKYSYLLKNCYWNPVIPLKNNIFPLSSKYNALQYSWVNGWPPIARSIFLAGKALNDISLQNFSNELCSSFLQTNYPLQLAGSPFCSGIAGFIATVYPLAQDTHNPKIYKTLYDLERQLTGYYDSNLPFGFHQQFYKTAGNNFMVDVPGFFYGTAGIALSLLLIQDKCKFPVFC